MSDIHDSNEPTPWEEINPPMALAQQAERPLRYSAGLEPATNEQFRNELTACLALVVPVGMTEEARREWLLVAWNTLGHLPPDILASGCAAARKICDHPSKIVPAIIAETEDWMETRRRIAAPILADICLPAPTKQHVMERRGEPMSEADTTELNRILEHLGATARYRQDGSKYKAGGNG